MSGDHAGPRGPRIQKRKPIQIRTGKRVRTGGYVGTLADGRFGYVTERDSHKHRIRALDAYAISEAVLKRLERVGVDTVIIVETDTGDVLEYDRLDFHGPHSAEVPDHFAQRHDDPQRFVATSRATRWYDHAANVYIPRGESVE